MTVTLNCAYRCDGGKAPTEATVDHIYGVLERYAKARGFRVHIKERVHFGPPPFSDGPLLFAIYRDYDDLAP